MPLSVQYYNDTTHCVYTLDSNPTTFNWGGTNARLSSILFRTDTNQAFYKSGPLATDWTIWSGPLSIVYTAFGSTGELVPAQLTANQNNYHPPGLETANVLFLTSNGAVDITGISFIATPVGVVAPPWVQNANGRHLWVYNGGGNPITLKHLNPGSQNENKIIGFGNADIVLAANGSCAHIYHSLAAGNVWVQIGN